MALADVDHMVETIFSHKHFKVAGVEINRDLPAKYKPMIDEYFKSLNRVHGIK